MAYLILVRHGQSEWNALGMWTGLTDVSLTEEGRKEAQKAAELLHDIDIHAGHVSTLVRAKETLQEITDALTLSHIPVREDPALNERDYGDLTGKNKWEVKEEHGEEQFLQWRRSWDHPVPGGETLKDVHDRIVPYFEEHIRTDLRAGKNVIVASHGNTLRALMKHLDRVSEEDIARLEMGTGEVHVYLMGDDGSVQSKEIRGTHSTNGL